MKIRENSMSYQVLLYLAAAEEVVGTAFMSPHQWARAAWTGRYPTYRSSVYWLMRKGLITIVEEGDQKLLQLTKQGAMETLLLKSKIPTKGPWDGKWRLFMFDIPEDAKLERDRLRWLLKRNHFIKFQSSVYISPYPLNKEAIKYLKDTGLNQYIRVLRVDEMDDDRELRKKFKI